MSAPESMSVSRTVSNTEEVYQRLRTMLLDGEIPPGAVLSQVQLAQQLNVSTTPLREAMRLLQAEGLLQAEHNRRSRVAPLNPRDIDAVYGARIALEALAIRLTVPVLRPDDLADLREDLREMREAGERQDLAAWEPVHARFHTRLTSGCGDHMTRVIDSVASHSERYRRSSLYGSPARTWEIGNAEHEGIVEACESRDPDLAALLLARHLARSALTVLAKVAVEEDPRSVREALTMVQRSSGAAGTGDA